MTDIVLVNVEYHWRKLFMPQRLNNCSETGIPSQSPFLNIPKYGQL